MAPRSTLRAQAPALRMMDCGKHARPHHVEEPRTPLGYMPKVEQRYYRKLARDEMRGSCICDYYNYPELKKERINAKTSTKVPAEPFPFMKLPAEIRNQIYEEVLVSDEAIEFCPEPFFFRGQHLRDRERDDWRDDYDRVEANNRKKMQNIASSMSILRVNKQVSAEATSFLYGMNEFRFSNLTGWVALDCFLFKIGLEKSAILRKIKVCHPDCVLPPNSISKEVSFGRGCHHFNPGWMREPAFFYCEKRWFEDETLSKDPVLILQKADKLEELGLVSPASTHKTFSKSPFDGMGFEGLTVTVISLRSDQHVPVNNIPSVPGVNKPRKATDAAELMAAAHLEEIGETWNYLDKVIDEDGSY